MMKTIHPLLSHYSSTKWGGGGGGWEGRGAYSRVWGAALIREFTVCSLKQGYVVSGARKIVRNTVNFVIYRFLGPLLCFYFAFAFIVCFYFFLDRPTISTNLPPYKITHLVIQETLIILAFNLRLTFLYFSVPLHCYAMDSVAHIFVGFSPSKQSGDENSAIITCSSSCLAKERQILPTCV